MFKSIDFSKYSSIKIGPKVDILMLESTSYPKDRYLIGHCNNLLLSSNPPKLMQLSKTFEYIKIEDNLLCIGGATSSGKVLSFAKKHNLANFELLSKLPGSIGGIVKMNAGLKEFEIFNNLHSIVTEEGEIMKKQIPYGYRKTEFKGVVFEAKFNLHHGFNVEHLQMFKKMRDNQPNEPSAGSCFKNPKNDSAGRLIQEVGLKGYRIGEMGFSKKHANFLVNYGKGTFNEALELIRLAQEKVFQKFNIRLENEIIIIDNDLKI